MRFKVLPDLRKINTFNRKVRQDTAKFATYFHRMLERGIYLPPSQFEAMFLSLAHSDSDIEMTINAARESLRDLAAG